MDIQFLFSSFFEYLAAIYGDLVLFLFKPRTYFAKVSNETKVQLTRRMLVYFVSYELVILSMLKAALPSTGSLDYFALFGFLLLDFILILIYIPIFALTSIVCEHKIGLSEALVYAISVKATFGVLPYVAYSIFLITEDYGFAVARGLALHGFILIYFLLFPLLFSRSFIRRIGSVAVSVSSSLILFFLIGSLSSTNSLNQGAWKRIHPLYDPIGREVSLAIREIESHESNEQTAFSKRFWGVPAYEVPVSRTFRSVEWPIESLVYWAELKREDGLLLARADGQKFRTTKALIELKRLELAASMSLLSAIDKNVSIMDDMALDKLLFDYKTNPHEVLSRPHIADELERIKSLRAKLDEYAKLQLEITKECWLRRTEYVRQANAFFDLRQRLVGWHLLLP